MTTYLLLDEAAVAELASGAPQNRDGHNRLASRSDRLGDHAEALRDAVSQLRLLYVEIGSAARPPDAG